MQARVRRAPKRISANLGRETETLLLKGQEGACLERLALLLRENGVLSWVVRPVPWLRMLVGGDWLVILRLSA